MAVKAGPVWLWRRAWRGRVGVEAAVWDEWEWPEHNSRAMKRRREKPTLDEIKSMFTHLQLLCVKTGRESCYSTYLTTTTTEHKLMLTTQITHVSNNITLHLLRRELNLSHGLQNQSAVHVHDFHSVIYGISLYECETEEQWVKLSPNKCLIIFTFLSETAITAPCWWIYADMHRAPPRALSGIWDFL